MMRKAIELAEYLLATADRPHRSPPAKSHWHPLEPASFCLSLQPSHSLKSQTALAAYYLNASRRENQIVPLTFRSHLHLASLPTTLSFSAKYPAKQHLLDVLSRISILY
ncbi:hypothetical protein V2G26_016452 [Clonostachys chloroleuca]